MWRMTKSWTNSYSRCSSWAHRSCSWSWLFITCRAHTVPSVNKGSRRDVENGTIRIEAKACPILYLELDDIYMTKTVCDAFKKTISIYCTWYSLELCLAQLEHFWMVLCHILYSTELERQDLLDQSAKIVSIPGVVTVPQDIKPHCMKLKRIQTKLNFYSKLSNSLTNL